MKRSIFLLLILFVFLTKNIYALSTLEIHNQNIVSGLVSKYSPINGNSMYNAGPALQLYTGVQRTTTRLFFEIDLTSWYSLSVSSTGIIKAELCLSVWNDQLIQGTRLLNFYSMNNEVDGTLSDSQYNADTDLIQNNIVLDITIPTATFMLTGSDLDFLTTDIENSENWSGFSLRLTEEIDDGYGGSGSITNFYHSYPPQVNPDPALLPVFKIYYDSAIPEPTTFILICLGLIRLLALKRNK